MSFKSSLVAAFDKYGIIYKSEQIDQFECFYNELVEYNNNVNLTAIVDEEEFIYKHLVDSLLPYEYMNKFSTILDIGAGAGFPSIPLKIINPNLRFSCIDSVNKKIVWLNYIKSKLKIDSFHCFHGRCEDLAFDSKFRESFDCVVARGVANLSTLLEYCVPFVKVGGVVVAYKASDYENELNLAKNAIRILGVELVEVKKYNDLEGFGCRNVLIFKKIQKTPSKYPRKLNKPRLNPI